MASVAVLQPKDCLPRNRIFNSDRRRKIPNSSRNPNVKISDGRRRKRSPGRNSSPVADPAPMKKLVMEQVKILKRGEVLGEMTNTNSKNILECYGDKSKLLGKLKDKRKSVLKKKNDRKVKFEGTVKNLKKKKGKFKGSENLPKLSELYAGSVVESPSPSSVPMPTFFVKEKDLVAPVLLFP